MKRALPVVLLVLLWTDVSEAHHILGIPHYKYDENYPQIPFVEVMAQVGAIELDFTYWPGTPKPSERVRFKLYVKNSETGEPYRDPLQVRYVKKSFLRADEVSEVVDIHVGTGPESNDYKFFRTFDEAEAYEVRLMFPNGDQVEVIPFPVTIGVTDDRPLIIGAVGVLVLAVLIVAVVKRTRKAKSSGSPGATRAAA